jgi:hypothetical protein
MFHRSRPDKDSSKQPDTHRHRKGHHLLGGRSSGGKRGIPPNPIKAIRIPVPKSVPPTSNDTRLIFVGTGTSGTLPHAFCTLLPEGISYEPGKKYCSTCMPSSDKYEVSHLRANTSIVVRKQVMKGKSKEWR